MTAAPCVATAPPLAMLQRSAMHLYLANHSSYPRPGESESQQRLRRQRGALQSGPSSRAQLEPTETIEDAAALEIIREQEAMGLEYVTDGQVRWGDPVSHFLSHIEGARFGGLLRFLDSDLLVSQPIIEAKLRRRKPVFLPDYEAARLAARVPVKAVLTGPYTLAKLSVIATTAYPSTAALATDLSMMLAEEVATLAAAGAPLIQVDEPLLLRHPRDVRLVRELLEPLHDASGDQAQLAVATYFGNAGPLYAQLNSLPADILALDCSEDSSLIDAVASTGSGKPVAFGLVDGRAAHLESARDMTQRLDDLLRRYVHEVAYIQPSCGLDYLPREKARGKLQLLAAVRSHFEGSVV